MSIDKPPALGGIPEPHEPVLAPSEWTPPRPEWQTRPELEILRDSPVPFEGSWEVEGSCAKLAQAGELDPSDLFMPRAVSPSRIAEHRQARLLDEAARFICDTQCPPQVADACLIDAINDPVTEGVRGGLIPDELRAAKIFAHGELLGHNFITDEISYEEPVKPRHAPLIREAHAHPVVKDSMIDKMLHSTYRKKQPKSND